MSPRYAGLALLLAVATLAACGSSGPSRSDFVAKADKLCRQSNKTAPRRPPRNAREAAQQTEREVTARVALDRRLRALEVPKSVKSDFRRYNAQTQQAIGLFRLQHQAAGANQEARFGAIGKRLNAVLNGRDRTAARIGFKECGRAIKKPQ
jgi:predicted small lipoprotein YifL